MVEVRAPTLTITTEVVQAQILITIMVEVRAPSSTTTTEVAREQSIRIRCFLYLIVILIYLKLLIVVKLQQ
jgi:hypothetical protein